MPGDLEIQTSEHIDSIPQHEITTTDLLRSAVDTLRIRISHPQREIMNLGVFVLVGMKLAFPEELSNEQLDDNPDFVFFNCVTWLGVELNDAVDIIPMAQDQERQEVVETLFSKWKKSWRASKEVAGITQVEKTQLELRRQTGRQPSPEETAGRLSIDIAKVEDILAKKALLRDYQREILYFEKSSQETAIEVMDLDTALNYRETANAISVVHNAAALLGVDALPTRTVTIPKESLDRDSLKVKYSWLIDGHPENDTERRLCALFGLVMAMQVLDDWIDIEDDRTLGIHNIGQVVLEDSAGDHEVAATRIQGIAEGYLKQAETFGVTPRAGESAIRLFKAYKKLMRRLPKVAGGYRERLLSAGQFAVRSTDT